MSLFKDGATVAETGVYDTDVIESGIIFYKGRVTGSSANFRFCIQSQDTNRTIVANRLQWGYTRYKTVNDQWLADPANSVAPLVTTEL